MGEKTDVKQGTLALMVLKTLDVLGPLHGWGIARRIEREVCNRPRPEYVPASGSDSPSLMIKRRAETSATIKYGKN